MRCFKAIFGVICFLPKLTSTHSKKMIFHTIDSYIFSTQRAHCVQSSETGTGSTVFFLNHTILHLLQFQFLLYQYLFLFHNHKICMSLKSSYTLHNLDKLFVMPFYLSWSQRNFISSFVVMKKSGLKTESVKQNTVNVSTNNAPFILTSVDINESVFPVLHISSTIKTFLSSIHSLLSMYTLSDLSI